MSVGAKFKEFLNESRILHCKRSGGAIQWGRVDSMGSTMLQSAPDADATWRTIVATTAALRALNGDAQTDVALIEIGERWSGMIAVVPSDFPYSSTHGDAIFYAFGSGGRGIALSSHKVRLPVAWRCGEQTGPGPMGSAGFRSIPFHSWRTPGTQP